MPGELGSTSGGFPRNVLRNLSNSKLGRVWSFPDFRLLWLGAFFSFTGSWIQNVAQSYFVYRMTGDESKLAFVAFCGSIPVFFFGFIAGSLSDILDKRKVLIVAQAALAAGAIFLSVSTYFGWVQYWHIVAVALASGFVGCIEMPTRQSIVSRVVPPEHLAAAVPMNAMTFNVARIIGPAIGGILLALFGVPICYLVNGLSFIALIWAAKAIKADLRPGPRDTTPIRYAIFEGFTYTLGDRRLRALFLLEVVTATFGLFYLPLIPPYVEQVLGLGMVKRQLANGTFVTEDLAKHGISLAYTAIGVGAFGGLLLVAALSDSPKKGNIIRVSMAIIGAGLIALSVVHVQWLAFGILTLVGMAVIMQLNTSNSLFQLLSPERLRGRVISMHVWALNGLSPFGILFFGWLARAYRGPQTVNLASLAFPLPTSGVALAMQIGGSVVLLGALAAVLSRQGLAHLEPIPIESRL